MQNYAVHTRHERVSASTSLGEAECNDTIVIFTQHACLVVELENAACTLWHRVACTEQNSSSQTELPQHFQA